MKTSDFDYNLPPEFIAQTPVEPRDSSRLLVLKRDTGALEHAIFRDIGQFLKPGDLLVINRTRVIPARLFARKPTGGRVEILLLRREDLLTWECLVGGKGLAAGVKLTVESGDSRGQDTAESFQSGPTGDAARRLRTPGRDYRSPGRLTPAFALLGADRTLFPQGGACPVTTLHP